MKVLLPDSKDDITLEQYDKFMLLDSDADNYEDLVFNLFTGISLEDIKNVPKKEIDEVLNHIKNALETEGKFKNRIKIDGVELGIIPNFDKVLGNKTTKGGEYCDMVSYSNEDENGYNKTLNKLLAVLYRPVVKSDKFGNYEIEKYNGTGGHLHLINKMPLSVVSGCLGFFLTLSNDLENYIQAYTVEEQLKESKL